MGPDYADQIVHVRQFKTKTAGTATYDVEMQSVSISAKARAAFGAFFKGRTPGTQAPALPAALTKISINISHTFNTRVRVRLMKQMAVCHQATNTDYKCFVTNFLPRPQLIIRHPSGKRDAFLFVEAVKRFGHLLTPDFLKAETAYAKGVGLDKLISTFIILTPDLIQPSITLTPAPPPAVKRTADQMTGTQHPAGPAKRGKGKGKRGGRGGLSTGHPTRSTVAAPLATANRYDALASPAEATANRSFTSAATAVVGAQDGPEEVIEPTGSGSVAQANDGTSSEMSE